MYKRQVVCDGFTGNVILKLTEGVAKMLLGMLKQMFLANLGGKLAYLLDVYKRQPCCSPDFRR